MGIALLIIGLILLLGGIAYLIYSLIRFCRDKEAILDKKIIILFGICGVIIALGGGFTQGAIQLLNGWDATLPLSHQAMGSIGGGLLMGFISVLATSFVLRYYKHNLDKKQRKIDLIVLLSSIPLVFGSFILFEEGVATAWSYPLYSGFGINGDGFSMVVPGVHFSGFTIVWYGVLILTGFLTSYFICDHQFYKKFGKHGILENCLVVVFIFGILGARLWYVVGNWNGDPTPEFTPFSERVANGDILSIFAFWEGGLTIMGGVIAGIVAGWVYLRLFRKYVPITFALDVVVPSILVAQVIGRWGNFFNHEVYGNIANISDGWAWLPTFIKGQMGYGLEPGKIYVPLFLVEGMINLAGFFLIAFGVPALWDFIAKKSKAPKGLRRAPGVLAGFYLVFYGSARFILEPFRVEKYNMGADGMWSIWNALAYIILGVLLIVALQLYERFLREKVEAKRAAKEAGKAKKSKKKAAKEAVAFEEEAMANTTENPAKTDEKTDEVSENHAETPSSSVDEIVFVKKEDK